MTAIGPQEGLKANVLKGRQGLRHGFEKPLATPQSVQPKAKTHLKELEDQQTIRGIVCHVPSRMITGLGFTGVMTPGLHHQAQQLAARHRAQSAAVTDQAAG